MPFPLHFFALIASLGRSPEFFRFRAKLSGKLGVAIGLALLFPGCHRPSWTPAETIVPREVQDLAKAQKPSYLNVVAAEISSGAKIGDLQVYQFHLFVTPKEPLYARVEGAALEAEFAKYGALWPGEISKDIADAAAWRARTFLRLIHSAEEKAVIGGELQARKIGLHYELAHAQVTSGLATLGRPLEAFPVDSLVLGSAEFQQFCHTLASIQPALPPLKLPKETERSGAPVVKVSSAAEPIALPDLTTKSVPTLEDFKRETAEIEAKLADPNLSEESKTTLRARARELLGKLDQGLIAPPKP